jgi:hypothetical protein
MNQYFLTTLALLALNVGNAQQSKSPEACNFIVDDVHYYQVKDVKAGSEVEFYSEKWGGNMLKSAKLNADGELIVTDRNFKPAFVLNKASGKLCFMKDAEFTLKDFAVEEINGKTVLGWNASVSKHEDIIFRIQKSRNGKVFEILSEVTGAGSEGEQPYVINDEVDNFSNYRIEVVNRKYGLRYSSPAMATGGHQKLSVYPSIVKDIVTVRFRNGESADYFITNISGQVVKTGKFHSAKNEIDLSDLQSGQYIVNVSLPEGQVAERITKL